MLIISKFHDYYDHVQQAGVDKRVVLQRKQEYVAIPAGLRHSVRPCELARIATKRNNNRYSSFLEGRVYNLDWLYFCGKAYPCITSHFVNENSEISDFKKHTIQELENIIPSTSKYFKKSWNMDMTPQQILHLAFSSSKEISTEIFRELNVPYFAIVEVKEKNSRWNNTSEKVLLYPNLTNYTSYLNMDAYSTYQEIEMYCSGVLGVGEPETIEVSDISKRDSKGFDKFSFKHRK